MDWLNHVNEDRRLFGALPKVSETASFGASLTSLHNNARSSSRNCSLKFIGSAEIRAKAPPPRHGPTTLSRSDFRRPLKFATRPRSLQNASKRKKWQSMIIRKP